MTINEAVAYGAVVAWDAAVGSNAWEWALLLLLLLLSLWQSQ